MADLATLIVNLQGDISGLKGSMNKAQGLFGGLKKSALALGGVFAGIFAVRQIGDFISESAKLADQQLKAEAALKQAVKGNEEAFNKLLKVAQEQQKITLFGDEETAQAQAYAQGILQNADAVAKLTPIAQDFAQAKGLNLQSAFELIGKTVGSSTNALTRYGIEIKGAAGSSERLQSAVNALNTAFGGQAEIAAKTGLGPLQQLKNTWGDIREEIGKAIIPVFNAFARALSSFLPAAVNAVKAFAGALRDFAKGWVDVYNESLGFRVVVESIALAFKNLYSTVTFFFDNTIGQIKAADKIFRAFTTGNLELMVSGFAEAAVQSNKSWTDFTSKLDNDFVKAIQNVTQTAEKGILGDETQKELASRGATAGTETGTAFGEKLKESAGMFITDVGDQLGTLEDVIAGLSTNQFNEFAAPSLDYSGGMTDLIGIDYDQIVADTEEGFQKVSDAAQSASQLLRETMANALGAVGESIGNALSGVAGGLQSGANAVLSILLDFSAQMGKILIAQGVAGLALKQFIKNPATAIAAGVALIALSKLGQNLLQRKQDAQAAAVPGLADGGIIPPGFPNDTFPARLSSGEAVIPLERLEKMNSGNRQTLTARVSGQDLLFILNEAERRQSNTL